MRTNPERGDGLRRLPFLSIAEEHFSPAPPKFETLAGDVVAIARRRGRDPEEFARELVAEAEEAAA